jgi:predicted short-subunit dehydrogenase-like oxidoreductase (DUF2520 family)
MVGASWSDRLLAKADIYLLAVSDRAVAEVAASLDLPDNAIVAHTAGCCAIDVLPAGRRGVFYPFQTFTAGRKVEFEKIHIFVEAESEDVRQQLEELAHRLTPHVAWADSARRAVIHLSGVFVSNFVNCMYADAAHIIARAGLGFEVLAPIAEETAAKAACVADPATVQTGPARRGDVATMLRHKAMLATEPQMEELYDKISENICQNAKISKNC